MPSAFGGTISLYELCVLIEVLDELELLVELAVLVEPAVLTTEELSPPRETSSFLAQPASIAVATTAAAIDLNNFPVFIFITIPIASILLKYPLTSIIIIHRLRLDVNGFLEARASIVNCTSYIVNCKIPLDFYRLL